MPYCKNKYFREENCKYYFSAPVHTDLSCDLTVPNDTTSCTPLPAMELFKSSRVMLKVS